MRAFAVSFSRFARKQIHVRCVWEIVKRRIVYYATPMYLWRTREARTFSAFFSAFDRLSFLSFSRDNKRYAKEYKYHTSDRWTKVRKRRIDEYRAIFEFLFSFFLFLSFFFCKFNARVRVIRSASTEYRWKVGRKEHKRIRVAIIGAKTFGQFCPCCFYCLAVTAVFQHFI